MSKEISKIPQPGEVSVDVGVLQQALNVTGADPTLVVDNNFGPKTRRAVEEAQIRIGLAGTGIPGEKLIEALGLKVVKFEPPKDITRQVIADLIVSIIQKDVDAKLRETGGKNRSPRIDSFNRRAKAYLGAPYCASGAWCAIDDACKLLGLRNPVPPTASSQAFRSPQFVPNRYLNTLAAKKGSVFILTNVGDAGHGHLGTLSDDKPADQNLFPTVEYNTDAVTGDREGDGAYAMKRTTVDRDRLNAGKIFSCFADIPQWVLDHNSSKT